MFKEIKNRDAWGSIRGFVYQVDTTILSWMKLKKNEILELEKGEDIDVVTHDLKTKQISRELGQIKYRESTITLNNELSLDLLFNFFQHKNSNSKQKIYFKFVTNTDYGIERPSIFHDGKSGIEVWINLRNSNKISKSNKQYLAIKNHIKKKIKERIKDESEHLKNKDILIQKKWKSFNSFIKDDKNFIELISDFEWSFRNDNSHDISDTIKRNLIDSYTDVDKNNVDTLYSRLFLFVFKLLSKKSLKTLNQNDFQKQTTFPKLNTSDRNIIEFINEILLRLDKRVSDVEEKVKLNSTQITSLIDDVELLCSSDNVFDLNLKNISKTPPSLINNGTLRQEKVFRIINVFDEYNWVNFQGINGTGKSQLASLVCSKFDSNYWLDLRAYNQDVKKTTLLIEAFLSSISSCPIISDRLSWVDCVIKKLSKNTLIVFNDLPRVNKDSKLSELLINLTKRNTNNVFLLTTSNFKIPLYLKQSIEQNTLFEYYDFIFNDEEIYEYITKQGASNTIKKHISLIALVSKGNPRLISSIIHHLKSINWGQGSKDLFNVILKNEFSTEILEDSQLSINHYIKDEKSRELLYRLSLIHWSFKRSECKAISEVEKKINYPNEKLQELLNIWIQKHENLFQISPLIYDIGINNLSQEVINNVHIAVAKSIALTKSFDQISASRCITSFINGKDFNNAGTVLFSLYKSIKSKEDINSANSWGFISFWSKLDIPKKMSVVLRSSIRMEQIRLNKAIGNDIEIYHKYLEEYAIEESLSISEKLFIHFIFLSNFEFFKLSNYWIHLEYVLKNWNLVDMTFKESISPDKFSGLLWMPVNYLIKGKDISLWLENIDKLKSDFKIRFFNDDIASTAVTLICDNIINSKKINEKKYLDSAFFKLDLLIEYFRNNNHELLETIVLKHIIILEFNFRKDKSKAKELTKHNVLTVKSKDAKYLLFENYGKLCFNDKQIEESQFWLQKAIKTDCTSQQNFIETLVYSAASISSIDSKKAIEYCESAEILSKEIVNYSELNYIQVLCELAIAYWIDKDYNTSFITFEDVLNRLLSIKNKENDKNWIRIFILLGHSLGYISSSVSRGKIPKLNDGEYVKPYQGIFSFITGELSDLYQSDNIPILLTHLAIFSEGVNNIRKAYHWSLRSFDLARKNGNQRIFLMVSSICNQYSLINFKVEEAFESFLLYSAVTTHLKGKLTDDIIKNIEFSKILSSKPSKEWNDAEDTTISFAIVPLLIIVLTFYLENHNKKEEKANSYKLMLQNYLPKASDRVKWEELLKLISDIIEGNIPEKDLLKMINLYGHQEKPNFQLICSLGLIYLNKGDENQLQQILNIFPHLIKLFSSSLSIIKFVLAPFLKHTCVNIVKENYIGNKIEYNELIDSITNVDINNKNIIQLIIQPAVKALDIELIENRKLWLYKYTDI